MSAVDAARDRLSTRNTEYGEAAREYAANPTPATFTAKETALRRLENAELALTHALYKDGETS